MLCRLDGILGTPGVVTLPDSDAVEWVGPGCDRLLPNCANTKYIHNVYIHVYN